MLCKNPYVKRAGLAYGCGQCIPCRISRRRIWAHRIMLEATQHVHNTFTTLTYNDENLPRDGGVSPAHLRNFIKRLRIKLQPVPIRYYVVGEYGDATWRPHYHGALFGVPNCIHGQTRYGPLYDRGCCTVCNLVRDTWGMGNIYLGSLETASASYIASYVTKKLTNKGNALLKGRHPEFARMSLKPGIGADALHDVASVTLQYLDGDVDVPTTLRHGPKLQPLGRYLTRKLRELNGKAPQAPAQTLAKLEAKVHHLREASENPTPYGSRSRFKDLLMEEQHGAIKAMEHKHRFYSKRRPL